MGLEATPEAEVVHTLHSVLAKVDEALGYTPAVGELRFWVIFGDTG